MRFGIFLPPMHVAGLNPHLAIKRDLQLIQLLDELGYDEAWVGEHHSAGSELIASPEVFIASAAERTKRIKLGTGVSSLPYHHPFMLADRIVLLDHLTEGRAMFGVGPGQLTTDAMMLGIDPATQRPRMEEAFDVIMRLFRGETVTHDAGWFSCTDAKLQLKPYSDFEVCVAASISPAGSKLAGRYGTGLLSIAATNPQGVELLSGHWQVVQENAEEHGNVVSRDRWRLMGPMHLAKTFEQAKENARYGLQWVFDYLSHIIPVGAEPLPTDYDDLVDALNASGQAVIGTPQMAVEQTSRLQEKSGGFGCYLHMGADFADWPATIRHYELFAEEVAPHFTGQLDPVVRAYREVMGAGDRYVNATLSAQLASIAQYQEERAAKAAATPAG
jgi:limonene 1,2-monooxygenase